MLRWKYEGTVPPDESFVAIGAPHTSNWDFVVFLAVLWEFRVRAGFLGKDTLFRWPLGILMRRLGGIPVNRARPLGVIDEAVAAFGKTRPMILVIAPESTRGRTPYWRSGFHRIAAAAEVRILPAFVDRSERRAGFGKPIPVTGDLANDMNNIRSYYRSKFETEPENMGPIRLRSEDG